MFANFTEETATDSGSVLTLLGATAGMIPFSASFADGDLVSYVAEDATNKVAGIGTYNSAANTITRNDTWNYNGTVVDKNPATNIALSATVTVRCDLVGDAIIGLTGAATRAPTYPDVMSSNIMHSSGYTGLTLTANTQYSKSFLLKYPAKFTSFTIQNNLAKAGSVTEIGISRLVGGLSESSYIVRASIDTTVSNSELHSTAFSEITLQAGWYVTHIVSTDALEVEACFIHWNPLGDLAGTNGNRHGVNPFHTKTVLSGILDTDPSTVLGANYDSLVPIIRLTP